MDETSKLATVDALAAEHGKCTDPTCATCYPPAPDEWVEQHADDTWSHRLGGEVNEDT
jgi:hypothetical protein